MRAETEPTDHRVKALNDGNPIGVVHHYLLLGEVDGAGRIVGLSDAERRRLDALLDDT